MEEAEYRVPVKLLTKREPIFFNRLSGLETAQWLVIGALTYFVMNALPLGLVLKGGVIGGIFMVGALFIHIPLNGLTGLEWLFIALRFRVEEEQHQTTAPNTLSLPSFTLTYSKSSEEIGFEDFEQPDLTSVELDLNPIIQLEPDLNPLLQLEPELAYIAIQGEN